MVKPDAEGQLVGVSVSTGVMVRVQVKWRMKTSLKRQGEYEWDQAGEGGVPGRRSNAVNDRDWDPL